VVSEKTHLASAAARDFKATMKLFIANAMGFGASAAAGSLGQINFCMDGVKEHPSSDEFCKKLDDTMCVPNLHRPVSLLWPTKCANAISVTLPLAMLAVRLERLAA
jgi:hypothetical protein